MINLKNNLMVLTKITLHHKLNIFEFRKGHSSKTFSPTISNFKIELIEVKGVESPSILALEIKIGSEVRTIPLYKYRDKFLFQNKVFILNTSKIPDLDLDFTIMDESQFYIKVLPKNEKFKLTLYCMTNEQELDLLFLQ